MMAPKKGTILYHYTDFLAADGILRGAQLRVNNVLRMNDSAEMRHFMNRLCSAVIEQLKSDGYGTCVQGVRNLFREELKKEYSAYAACFSFASGAGLDPPWILGLATCFQACMARAMAITP